MPFKIMFIICILGSASGAIGGLLSILLKIKNKDFLASLFEITAGIMTGVVCFDMIPECFYLSNILFCIIGVVLGVFIIYSLDDYVEKNIRNNKKNEYSKSLILIIISMTFHNFIEGIAIGSSMVYSLKLGIVLLISIVLHDIPESMVVGIISKTNNKSNKKMLFNSTISGLFTGFGALVGAVIGKVNNIYISICLSIAAGAMLYVVACVLIPTSKKISKSKRVYIVYIVGILIGAIISKI